jgi:protein-S-isoprenylcysteine O-methyltransferase Ste14
VLFRRKLHDDPLCQSLFALGFGFIARVYRENTYTSATIEVTEGQRVITTGPYAFVRHPMYASALVYVVGTPLALGSCWGFLALALMLRYRLVPFLW